MGSRKSKSALLVSPTELTDQRLTEISRRTNLTANEIRRRHQTFLHQYPSGFISREQLEDNLTEVWPEGNIGKFSAHLFAAL